MFPVKTDYAVRPEPLFAFQVIVTVSPDFPDVGEIEYHSDEVFVADHEVEVPVKATEIVLEAASSLLTT